MRNGIKIGRYKIWSGIRIGRYKIWYSKTNHCCGFRVFRIPIIGRFKGRRRKLPISVAGISEVGGFTNYWLWRFTLTIFHRK
jgi:hypothetical protein